MQIERTTGSTSGVDPYGERDDPTRIDQNDGIFLQNNSKRVGLKQENDGLG